MKDTITDFTLYCSRRGITLNEAQYQLAIELFSQPIGSGKSTLIALLFDYDSVSQKYADIELQKQLNERTMW